jgi:ubiquinone/menaquinone biosynthesis C-methylase UbiE
MTPSRRIHSLVVPLILVVSVAVALWVFLNANSALAQSDQKITNEKPKIAFSPVAFSYTQRKPSRDGIGKIYMDREISQVMGHTGIHWLERGTREREENPTRAVQGLELAADAVVADIGSGSGYYTFRIAPLVPKGTVIGVDIQPEMVRFLSQKSKELGASNVKSHLGKIDSIELDAESIDAVILVDAYHEFSHPNEMMQSVFYALRPKGRVYLLEYRAEDPKVPIKPLHKMTEAQSIKEMKAVGLNHLRTDKFLPWQHFMIFEKPESPQKKTN